MKLPRSFPLRVLLAAAVLLALGGGYYVARYHLWSAYRDWSIGRMNAIARSQLDAGDPRAALLTVRKVLRKRPSEVNALRLGVEAARREGSTEVVALQRRLGEVERTLTNRLELIRLAVEHQLPGPAVEAVEAVGPEARDQPEFHRLAAEAYLLARRDVAAKYHLLNVLALAPNDAAARLKLAAIEFEAGLPPDWLPRVRQLARDPVTALPAAVLLLQHALATNDQPQIEELAARLQRESGLSLSQQLHVLDALLRIDPAAAAAQLDRIMTTVADRPADVVRVLNWLTENGRLQEAREWFSRLPTGTRQSDPVRLTFALALERGGLWGPLLELTAGPRWPTAEALRLAVRARAFRQTGQAGEFAETWKLALVAGGRDLRIALQLLRTVEQWKWEDERLDVLWKVFNLLPGSRTVRNELIAHEFKTGNTVNLNKIFARILEAEPANAEARNNFAYTSLLLGANVGRSLQLARDLHREFPDNLSYLTTYTLALHRLGRTEQALALLRERGENAMTASGLMHEVIYAASQGQIDRVGTLLPQLAGVRMLPEERSLFADALSRHERELARRRGRNDGLLASLVPAGGGWLDLLPGRSADAPPEWRTADGLYRERNFTGLRDQLDDARWPNAEHLRSALLAWAAKEQRQDSGFRDSWRQALAFARTPAQLAELETLARDWRWEGERLEAAERRFERQADDPVLLAELLEVYRRQERTHEMARTLWLYLNATQTRGPEAAWCVYYSLLCDMNTAAAQTLAHQLHAAVPQDAPARLAYAFALWRQGRAAEAWLLLPPGDSSSSDRMSAALVKAAILATLQRPAEATQFLDQFRRTPGLPEEMLLAKTISLMLEQGNRPIAALGDESRRL